MAYSAEEELLGVELFKSDVITVLERAENYEVILSGKFTSLYREIFGEKFCPSKYGFESTSFYGYFNQISDVVSFKKIDGKLAISLKEQKSNRDKKDCKEPNLLPGEVGPQEEYYGLAVATSKCSSSDDMQSTGVKEDEEQLPLQQTLSGIDLLKCHLKIMLEGTSESKVDFSMFKQLYKEQFSCHFSGSKYGLPKGKLSKVLLLESLGLSNFISLEHVGSVLFLKLKDGAEFLGHNKEESRDTCKEWSALGTKVLASQQLDPGLSESINERHTCTQQPLEPELVERKSNDARPNQSHLSCPMPSQQIDCENPEAKESSSVRQLLWEASEQSRKMAETKPLKGKAVKKAGEKLFGHDVREVLLNVQEGRIELNKFSDYYEKRFNTKFIKAKYKFSKTKQILQVFKKIPDVVSLERKGDVIFIKLNDRYVDVQNEEEEKDEIQQIHIPHDQLLTVEPHEPETMPLQAAAEQHIEEISQRATECPLLSFEGIEANDVSSNVVYNQDHFTYPKLCQWVTDDAYDSVASEAIHVKDNLLMPQAASTSTSKITGRDLFTQEIRGILQEHGRILVSRFGYFYEIKFNAKFTPEKYEFQKKMKFKTLLKQFPEVISLETKGQFLFMKLNDSPQKEENDVEEMVKTRQIAKDQLMTPDVLELKTVPLLPTVDKQSPVTPEGHMPSIKKKVKDFLSDSVCKESQLSRPSPFEDSFNLSQTVEATPPTCSSKRRYRYTPHEVNALAKQVVGDIVDEGHYVSLELVKAKLCEIMQIRNLKDLGYRNPDVDIPELKELQRLHSKLDLYARAYVMVHSISTLTEIGQSMARLLEKKDFQELRVGPLVKLPVIFDLFKAPSDGSVSQQITTLQVLKHLNQYLTKEDKWTSKVKLQDFIQYMCDEYDCSTPYELGVRVQSVGLGISVLKRAQKAQSERSRKVEEEITEDLEKEFERRCKKIKDDLLGSSHEDERSIIRKLLGSSVIDILMKVFDQCSVIYQHCYTIKKADLSRVQNCLEAFVANKSLRKFFNLALHFGCKEIVQDLLDECKEEMIDMKEKEQLEKEKAIKPPDKRKLIQEVKQWLNSAEDLSLSTLAQIEDRVTDHFTDFPTFVSFGYGTFLEFLTKKTELNKILEERGTLLCGVAVSHCQADSADVLEFVRQCGTQVSKDAIQRTLCGYYHVNKITDLGFSSLEDVISEMNRKKPLHNPCVHYESAILCKDEIPVIAATPDDPCISTESKVLKAGKLGWKNRDEALVALRSTPLLADMRECTQWTTVFEPCLGNLKQFIEEQEIHSKGELGCKIEALETSSKALLRINTEVSREEFYKCVDKEDVIGTSGNLVSLVIKYGGIKATPLTMLTNHMRPALSKLASADQLHVDGGSRCPRFVLHCLCRIPHSICMALADKVFLEPLDFAVGTRNSCQLLLSCCDNHDQRSRLHQLGLDLGKIEWIKDLEAFISGKEKVRENKEKISLKDLRPVALVKPVSAVEEIVSDIEESQEEISEDKELPISSDSEEEYVETEDSASTASEDEEPTILPNPCKAIIDSIRKEEFGIGVVLGEEEGKLVQKQREREGRSLHRLSAELYNRDTHFVLELVQNADDNTYMDDTPALMFVIDSERIVVLNNEVGFNEKNIRALCDVGKSTKGPHQYGYIGQKGIGFKSVFRVSDTPEVHSNGYHIRFDAKSGPSGYILPHWVEPDIKEVTAGQDDSSSDLVQDHNKEGHSEDGDSVDSEFDGWMTKIVLPLKEEFHSDKKTSLSARFHDVHPSLLLFLHRLRSIAIVIDNQIQRMTRQDLDDGIIQINHSNGTDRLLVVKKQLDARDVREDVEMTELALAFPMPGDKELKNLASYNALPPQNVFAYLPLRSYGFKFIIQGDFEVPSSREDVDGDKAWNQWLREEIPKLFIDALEVFKQHPLFPGLSSVVKFFQFVPLEEEILDFFTPVSSAILKYLQGIPCLPVEKADEDGKKKTVRNNGGDIQDYDWMQPCSVVVCDDQKIRDIITPTVLRKHLNLNYLAQEVSPAINPALRSKLGVQTLSAKHLIDIGRSVLNNSDNGPPNVRWIAHWLHCIHRSLESEHNSSSDTLNEIATMDVIPLSDNTFVNLKDHAVFFPLSTDHEATKSKNKKSKASYLQELERDLSVIHPDLLSHLGNVGQSQVQKLLRRLGVKSWSAGDVIHEHILPTLKSDKWKSKSNAVIQSYLVYIFDQRLADQSLCSMDELKDCCQVLTNHGPVNPSEKPVHFTPKYCNTLDLRVDLSSISWTLLDDSYLDMSANHSTRRQDWEKFFSDLGVGYFLAMERKTVRLTKMNLDDSPWALYYKEWPETSDGVYIVEDYCCSELEEFMKNPTDSRQAKVIAENLDTLWDTQYLKYADYVPVTDSEGRKLQATLSSFMLLLRTKEWLPVVAPLGSFMTPRNAFADTPQLRSLLSEHVSYADVKLKDESFIKSIELQFTISVEGLLQHLRGWASKAPTSVGKENEFVTSLVHMKAVYSFLHEKCKAAAGDKAQIKEAFQKNPLIFVPRKDPKTPEKMVQGGFYHMKEVCWNDPSEVTLRLVVSKKYTPKRQILSPYYKEIHDFLRLELHVDPTPHADEYIEMAAVLVDGNSLPTPAILESIFDIFAVLGEKCLKENHKSSYMHDPNYGGLMGEAIDISQSKYFQAKLQQVNIFPCADRWVALEDKPIIPDNKQSKKIFEQEKDVYFITLEHATFKSTSRKAKVGYQKNKERIAFFLNACGIPKLSEIVEEELIPKNVEYQCHEVQSYFHKTVPCIQRYLYSHLEERYKELKSLCFSQKLSEMTFATVEKLEVVYHLKSHPDVTVVQGNKYGYENVGQTLHFYAVRQQSTSTESLNKEITKLFTNASSVSFGNFLSRLSTKLDDGLENFLEEQEVDPLPDHEEKWFVPEPEIPSKPEPEPVEDSFEPPVVRRITRPEDDGALHCWPPRSSATGIKPSIRENNPNQQKHTEMWPEPEAPDSMRKQPQSLAGSRLPSYVSTVPDQYRLEPRAGDSVTQTIPKHDNDGINRQPLPTQDVFVGDKQEHRPVILGENPTGFTDAPNVVASDNAGELRVELAEDVHLPPQVVIPHSTPKTPTHGNELAVFSPALQASPFPNPLSNVPAVFSPTIQVTLEEYEPEELPTSSSGMPLTLNVSLNDSSDKNEIGRWGEQFLYEYLKEQDPPDSRVVEVRWVNEHFNSTSPYDIETITKDINGMCPDIVTYIEVKSTSAEDKGYFEISVPELSFALEKREAFHLYRLFNAGDTRSIRILRVQNLAHHLERKSVKILMVV